MANILTPASGLCIGDKNGAMQLVQIGCNNVNSKLTLDWMLPSGQIFTETANSADSYMVQRD